jgi:hypothetical protein
LNHEEAIMIIITATTTIATRNHINSQIRIPRSDLMPELARRTRQTLRSFWESCVRGM